MGLTAVIESSLTYLSGAQAVESFERDPYWPKWDSPWWHMTLLWEMGLAAQIPRLLVNAMVESMNTHFLKFFPRPGELPQGADPYRHVVCHCALGTMYQVLGACEINVDAQLPWIRSWFLKYQLPDGGLNCDESAYGKSNPKSSIVSTLPVLEAVLSIGERSLTREEQDFLDRGAQYLMNHRLFRSFGHNKKIINEEWLKLCFPRFYEYDILRGLTFLVRWANIRGRSIPGEAVNEALGVLRERFVGGQILVERQAWAREKTLVFNSGGQWNLGQSVTDFSLLRETSYLGSPCEYLSKAWSEVLNFMEKQR